MDPSEPRADTRWPATSPTRLSPICRTWPAEAAPHGKYVHLYLNGMYWGLYNLHERPDDSFADEYYGGDKDDYDVIKHNPAPDIAWAEGGVTALNNYQTLLTPRGRHDVPAITRPSKRCSMSMSSSTT